MQAPPAQIVFTRAVHVVFGEWTALKLAVENEFAGGGTRTRALALLQRVLDGLLASTVVHRDELQELLDIALLDDFNIEAEDDSPQQVAEVLCALHAEALTGSTATAEALLARAAGKQTWVEVPPPPRAAGDSSDDDCEDDDDDHGGGGGGGGGVASAMDDDEGASQPRPEPEVDEDGFQMVSSRRGRGGRR